MMYPTRVRDQIRQLADELAITPPELLKLAREAAQDATLRSVDHLRIVHAEELRDVLRIIRLKTLAQQAASL